MPPWLTIMVLVAVSIVPACSTTSDGSRGTNEASVAGDGARWPFWPEFVRVHPLTRFTVGADEGDGLTLECRLEFRDTDGVPCRCFGSVRVVVRAGAAPGQDGGERSGSLPGRTPSTTEASGDAGEGDGPAADGRSLARSEAPGFETSSSEKSSPEASGSEASSSGTSGSARSLDGLASSNEPGRSEAINRIEDNRRPDELFRPAGSAGVGPMEGPVGAIKTTEPTEPKEPTWPTEASDVLPRPIDARTGFLVGGTLGDGLEEWVIDLGEGAVNRRYFDDVLQTYLLRLRVDHLELGSAVEVAVEYVGRDGQVARDERRVEVDR